MKNTEKNISQFVENQFPAFYAEEGPQFVAFVKAYYEWLELDGNPIYEARRLPDYRDIDSTLDEFIIYFKEKYLKNIQFDTATNKILLVKNALDLYRSKGSERSVDLFFKLIYGTDADVSYPAENIIKASDGIWEKPRYLEIAYSKYNVDYVGKQIIGAVSGSTAFVERYIRRKTNRGYVNLLYISQASDNFAKDEIIGINVNGSPSFVLDKRVKLIGSVSNVIIQDRSRDFNVGDIVTFTSSGRGIGGVARVSEVRAASGVIDFIFEESGWGYTIDANSIVSEKVISTSEINPDPSSEQTFRLFESANESLINLAFSSASANLAVGSTITRYASGSPTASAKIINLDQSSNTGNMTVSHIYGAFVNNATYFTSGNVSSFVSDSIENRTITGKVMGIPTTYTLSTTGQIGEVSFGDTITQKINSRILGSGVVQDIISTVSGNVITVSSVTGSLKISSAAKNYYYTSGTGNITSYIANTFILGSGTNFDRDYEGGFLYSNSNTELGTVLSVINSTALLLTSTPTSVVTSVSHSYGPKLNITTSNNSTLDITSISSTVGMYEIRKYFGVVDFISASSANIINANNIYQYTNGIVSAKAKVMTAYESGLAGNVSVILISGYFEDGKTIYTDSNTYSATLDTYQVTVAGGDYIASPHAKIQTVNSNTEFVPTSISFGSGAAFNIASIGDTETIFIGTDMLSANNVDRSNYSRRELTVGSNTGIALLGYVYQEKNKVAFNANTSVNAATGAFTLLNPSSKFVVGDIVKYSTATGNTAITGMANNDLFYVLSSNTSTVTLSLVHDHGVVLNDTLSPEFTSGATSEAGHYLSIQSSGKVFNSTGTSILVKDILNSFSISGGTANTTQYANSNLILYGNTSVNTAVSAVVTDATTTVANQAFMSLPLSVDSYGFPKNSSGNIKDRIYSCLTFQQFTIGSIGGLTGIDPGSEYNVDPYVLAHQPYISAFDRKDYTISIANATGTFLIGEKINQSSANLVHYNLKVDKFVNTETYVEKINTFNSAIEVDDANDFIYTSASTIQFNANTEVNDVDEFINITDHTFLDGDYVRYYTDTGNTVIGGLANNTYYYVVSSNTAGIKLSSSFDGVAVDITASATAEDGHNIKRYLNTIANNNMVLYRIPVGNTAISGLTDNTRYYAVNANSSGFAVSTAYGGANVDITANVAAGESHTFTTIPGYQIGDRVYQYVLNTFNGNTAVNSTTEFITLSPQPYEDGDNVQYYTDTGNTVISGLANAEYYYVVNSNTSGIKLSTTVGGGAIDLTGTAISEAGHNILSTTNAEISLLYADGANTYVRVRDVTNTLANNYTLFSYTNLYLDGLVSNVEFQSITSTATGIVKSSNNSAVNVKRLNFENTFIEGQNIIGDVSGTSANVISVTEDNSLVYPIGLNAIVTANVVTANGQVSSLQIVDSGFGFSNSELVQYTSEDGTRAGTIKIVTGGIGIGKGYYRSSKGFLSSDMYIHDGDFYQEYSYEILSKMSFEKYSSMFKTVMHVAGTKFFGSVRIVEVANVQMSFSDSSILQANTI